MSRVARLPQIDLASFLAQQNPQIDLKLSAYEASTRNFLKAVANYKNRAIATISDRRMAQAAEKKKVLEKTQAIEAETNQCKLREIELVAELEREKEERKDAELSIAALKRQLASLNERCAAIEAEIEQYRAITSNLQRERNKERSILGTHASIMVPELNQCERLLGCVVEGVNDSADKDQLLIRFSNIDASEPGREFSFVIDVSEHLYKVVTTSPPLPSLPILVDNLNNTRDIYSFIIQVRMAYQALSAAS